MTICLSIKKEYFNKILDGSKRIEYRKTSDYYHKTFSKNPNHIIFHYYQKERIKVKVESIELIERPEHLNKDILPTDVIYKISISDPVLI